VTGDYFKKIEYFKKGRFVLAETFSTFQESLDLLIEKISARNSLLKFASKYLV
jgi:hypothetical protein